MARISRTRALLARYATFVKEVARFVRQCLGNKKIVVISEQNILSMPISFRAQALVVSLAVVFIVWVSYSSGKYFAYKDVISDKEQEIWLSHATNENLQYQVFDLHRNLTKLNKYFENIPSYQLASRSELEKEVVNRLDFVGLDEQLVEAGGVGGILDNIRNKMVEIRAKVIERIESLELVIQMTGMTVEDIARNDKQLRKMLKENKRTANTGGAYIPVEGSLEGETFDTKHFDKEVAYLMTLEKAVKRFPLVAPMDKFRITSGYGKRIDPLRGTLAMHRGTDFVGPYKAAVKSSADGVVVYAGRKGAYGFAVEIDHGSSIVTRYGHLNRVLVKKRQKVKRGQVIGVQGNTGRSTGTHLHYEIRVDGKSLDPEKFLEAGKYVF